MLARPLLVSQREACVDQAEIEARTGGVFDGSFILLHDLATIWR